MFKAGLPRKPASFKGALHKLPQPHELLQEVDRVISLLEGEDVRVEPKLLEELSPSLAVLREVDLVLSDSLELLLESEC